MQVFNHASFAPCKGSFRWVGSLRIAVCAGLGFVLGLPLSGCESGGAVDAPSSGVSTSSTGFVESLAQAKTVTRGELLRGLLIAATGTASATFSDNAEFAERSGLGSWKDPAAVVTVEEACRGTIACMNGVDAKIADPLGVLAAANLLNPQRTAAEAVSGQDVAIMLRGVTEMTRQNTMFDLAATIPTGAKAAAAAPGSSPASAQASSAPAKGGESFEDFGAASAAAPAPAAKPAAAPPTAAAPAPAAPTDVPSVRPEPLPPVPGPSTAPAAPKRNPWTPGTPVPQKPKDPPKEQPKDPKASPPAAPVAPKPKAE